MQHGSLRFVNNIPFVFSIDIAPATTTPAVTTATMVVTSTETFYSKLWQQMLVALSVVAVISRRRLPTRRREKMWVRAQRRKERIMTREKRKRRNRKEKAMVRVSVVRVQDRATAHPTAAARYTY